MNANLQSEVSQIEYVQNEVSQVKQEALQWKNECAIKNAELTKLKGSTEEMAKLKEDIETLRKENAVLKGDLEAQRVQVCCFTTKLHQYLNCQMHLAIILLHVRAGQIIRESVDVLELDRLFN